MTDIRRIESAAAAKDATEAAGRPQARGSRAADVEGGLMRYLAAEAYHEKAAEDADVAPGGTTKRAPSR